MSIGKANTSQSRSFKNSEISWYLNNWICFSVYRALSIHWLRIPFYSDIWNLEEYLVKRTKWCYQVLFFFLNKLRLSRPHHCHVLCNAARFLAMLQETHGSTLLWVFCPYKAWHNQRVDSCKKEFGICMFSLFHNFF